MIRMTTKRWVSSEVLSSHPIYCIDSATNGVRHS